MEMDGNEPIVGGSTRIESDVALGSTRWWIFPEISKWSGQESRVNCRRRISNSIFGNPAMEARQIPADVLFRLLFGLSFLFWAIGEGWLFDGLPLAILRSNLQWNCYSFARQKDAVRNKRGALVAKVAIHQPCEAHVKFLSRFNRSNRSEFICKLNFYQFCRILRCFFNKVHVFDCFHRIYYSRLSAVSWEMFTVNWLPRLAHSTQPLPSSYRAAVQSSLKPSI